MSLVTTESLVLRLPVEEGLQIWRVAANMLNRKSRAADKGWSSRLVVGRATNDSPLRKASMREMSLKASDLGGLL